MSPEPTELERSALERKDRDELHTIAEAMGGRPGSRARKGEIVDMILELAGVTEAPDTSPDTGPDTGPGDDGEHLAPVEATAPAEPVGSIDQRAGDAAAAVPDDGDASDDHRDAPEVAAKARTSRQTRPKESGAAPSREGARGESRQGSDASGGHRSSSAPGDQAPPAASEDRGNQASQAGQAGRGNQADRGGPQASDDGDAGNRRRRRRGRGERPGADEPFEGEPIPVAGILDLRNEGYGFLRLKGYLAGKDDVYVSVKQVRQLALRKGDFVKGASRPASRNEKNPALLRIDEVNGVEPEQAKARPDFDDLTALFPDQKLRLEAPNDPYNMTTRIIDLIAPIGKGTRGLIVSPPKAGKTTVMKQIARSIETNNPEVHLIVLLVDERPEEVTDMKRWVKGEVAASTFDRPTEEHTEVAELTIERAKRLVEYGKDVVVILDGITRLARAYNLSAPATGRVMSGGIDTGALYPPKKFFGAARNLEEGGSLTILATALVETGSRMDEVIFEEFKGTGNMELRLDRKMADRRIYPAIDVEGSSTRHEELLFKPKELQQVWKLRRVLSALDGGSGAGLELLIDRMKTFKSNDEFLTEVAKAASIGG